MCNQGETFVLLDTCFKSLAVTTAPQPATVNVCGAVLCTISGWLGSEGTSQDPLIQTPAHAGSPRAGCPGLCPATS